MGTSRSIHRRSPSIKFCHEATKGCIDILFIGHLPSLGAELCSSWLRLRGTLSEKLCTITTTLH